MPFKVRKVRNKEQWRVINAETKEVKGTHDSIAKAYEQLKIIDDEYKKKNGVVIHIKKKENKSE
jgi:hypothetical protein